MSTRQTAFRALAITTLAVTGLALGACEGENLFRTGEAEVGLGVERFDAVTFRLEDQEGQLLDLVQDGATFELELDEGTGAFSSAFDVDGVLFNRTGTFDIDGERIRFSDDPFFDDGVLEERAFDFDDADDVLTLTDPQFVWDMDDDGLDEVVDLEVRLERR